MNDNAEALFLDAQGNAHTEAAAAQAVAQEVKPDIKPGDDSTPEEKKKIKPTAEELWLRHLRTDKNIAYTTDTLGTPIVMLWKGAMGGTHWSPATKSELEALIQLYLQQHKGYYSTRNIAACMKMTPVAVATCGKIHLKEDRNRAFISTKSCVLEITREGLVMHDHSRSRMARTHVDINLDRSRMVDGKYIPRPNDEIEVGLFGKLIKDAFPDDLTRGQVQEMLGDTLSPILRKAVTMLIGEADTGKSQILDMMGMLHHNSVAGDFEQMEGFDASHYAGKSVIFIDEVPPRLKSESMFKRMVGGSTIMAKVKYGEALNIRPDFKIVAGANQMMNSNEKTNAIMTRLRLFKVADKISGQKIDEIGRKIMEGYRVPGETVVPCQALDVLEWAMNGALAVAKRGRVLAIDELNEESLKLHRVARESAKPCSVWIDEVEVEPSLGEGGTGSLVPKSEVYRLFKEWAEEQGLTGHAKVSAVNFGREYFARSMREKFGPDWNEGRDSILAKCDGKKVACYPIVFRNLNGVKYVGDPERMKFVAEREIEKKKKAEPDMSKWVDSEGAQASYSTNDDWDVGDVQAKGLSDVL